MRGDTASYTTATRCSTRWRPRVSSASKKSASESSNSTSRTSRSSTSTRRSCWRHAAPEQRLEQLRVTIKPGAQGEPFRALTGSGCITLTVLEHTPNNASESLRGGGLVLLPCLRMRNADAGLVADELDLAAAPRIEHG